MCTADCNELCKIHTGQRNESNDEPITIRAISEEEHHHAEKPEVDYARLIQEQENDPILNTVHQWLRDGSRGEVKINRSPDALISYWRQFSLLSIQDGLIKRKWSTKKEGESRDLIVVPESMEDDIIQMFHDSPHSCHPGISNSVAHCRQYFYWPKMEDDFKLYIQGCEKCAAIKQPTHYLKAPLKHLVFDGLNRCLTIDHIEPGTGVGGFTGILTMTDAWSNYIAASPTRGQTALENINLLEKHWILRFGVPREIILDNAPGFSSTFFHLVQETWNCKVTHGQSYCKTSTSRAEKTNKRINSALRAVVTEGRENEWPKHLQKAVFCLNSLQNNRTGFSAHRMVYGQEAGLPTRLVVQNPEVIEGTPFPHSETRVAQEVWKRDREFRRIIRQVRRNVEQDIMYADNSYNKHTMGPFFEKGDLCYTLISCPSHKFGPRWEGPFPIVEKVHNNDHLYRVQISPDQEPIVVTLSKLKPFKGRSGRQEAETRKDATPDPTNTPAHGPEIESLVPTHQPTSSPSTAVQDEPPTTETPTHQPTSGPSAAAQDNPPTTSTTQQRTLRPRATIRPPTRHTAL